MITPNIPQNDSDYPGVTLIHYDFVKILKAVMVTIGSTAFSPSAISGAIFVLGVFVSSPIMAFMMILGSCLSICFQMMFGVDDGEEDS